MVFFGIIGFLGPNGSCSMTWLHEDLIGRNTQDLTEGSGSWAHLYIYNYI